MPRTLGGAEGMGEERRGEGAEGGTCLVASACGNHHQPGKCGVALKRDAGAESC